MKRVNLYFKLTLSPLIEKIIDFDISSRNIKSVLENYKTDDPNVYEGTINNFLVLNNKLDIFYEVEGLPGQIVVLEIKVNETPIPNIITSVADNHYGVCDNNNSNGYIIP